MSIGVGGVCAVWPVRSPMYDVRQNVKTARGVGRAAKREWLVC